MRTLRPNERAFVMTRASYAGGQRYAVTWTGDNSSTWDHLKLSIHQLLNLGLSGFSYAGADVGGFTGGPSAELMTRWFEIAAFTPIFRDHSAKDAPRATLADIQHPIIDAYLAALPKGCEPRIMASRSVFAAEDREEALRLAGNGLRRALPNFMAGGHLPPGDTVAEMITAFDTHVGTPDDVIASLRNDSTLERVTDLVFQVHSVDPPHAHILRCIELVADKVAPALGWSKKTAADVALV